MALFKVCMKGVWMVHMVHDEIKVVNVLKKGLVVVL